MKIQWFKNGDHPKDDCEIFDVGDGPFQGEGKIVRYYRHPDISGESLCPICDIRMHDHGWIDNHPHDHVVCPGDYIFKDSIGYFSAPSLKTVVQELEARLNCNCDLDKWEPERDTGHSHVCRIHKLTQALWQ
jgi:hypothetical protein